MDRGHGGVRPLRGGHLQLRGGPGHLPRLRPVPAGVRHGRRHRH